MKVKVMSSPYILQVLYVLCFTRPRYQVSVYRTIGPLLLFFSLKVCDIKKPGLSNAPIINVLRPL